MKKLLALTLLFGTFLNAQGDSRIVYNSTRNQTILNESIIPSLPNEGRISADQFCFDGEEDKFIVNTEEERVSECVRSRVDHSDSTRPRTICLERRTRTIPAKTFSINRSYTEKECTKWDYSRDYRHPTCVSSELVSKTYPLYYTEITFNEWDYRRENPIRNRKDIPYCK